MNNQLNDIESTESKITPPDAPDAPDTPAGIDPPDVATGLIAGDDGPIADSVFLKLDHNFVRAEKIVWWISEALVDSPLVVLIVFTWVFGWFPDWMRIILTLILVCLFTLLRFLAMRSPWWVYNTTSYSLSPLGMVIRRGIFWKREEHIPRSRIQHTDVTQGPIQRHFQIGTIVLHTAGTHNASVQLSGLNYQRACRIRDYLIVGGPDDAV